MKNYVKYIRSMVGDKRILMNFAVAAIFNDEDELLLQKRAVKKKWGLPGGVVELGETLEQAVIREINEETGLTIKPTTLIGIYTGPRYYISYPNGDKIQPVAILFRAEIVGGKLTNKVDDETLELKFFPKDSLPEIANNDFKDMIEDAFVKKKGVWH